MLKPLRPLSPVGTAESSRDRKNKLSWSDTVRTLRKVWTYLAAHRWRLLGIFCLVVVSSMLGLLGPYMLGYTIDSYTDAAREGKLTLHLALLAGVYVLYSLTTWLQNYWMIGIAQKTVFTLRERMFQHLHKLPVGYFAKRQHGELMSRLTNDMDNVSSTLNSSFIQLVSSLVMFAGMLVIMLLLSPLLTLLTLLIVPAMFLGMKWITSRTGRYFKEQQRHMGDLNGFVEETLSGQSVVKTLSLERSAVASFDEKAERLRVSGYWAQTYSGFIPKLMNMLNNLSFAVIAGAGGLLAMKGLITIGTIVVFAEYARQFTRPLNDLANQFNTFLSAVAGAERVFDVLEEKEEASDERDALFLPQLQGDIQFAGVSFSYDKETPVLEDIHFHVSPGETIAFVGPTGAGKSTIVQLITRFYDADRGRILVDGHDIRTIRRSSLRRSMGFVLQDVFLFQGTIRDNIRYGRLDATDEEVEQAARQANAHSFIMKLPDRYDTVLRHDGSGISQGQKQLLSIARAILADPAILILDEATSSIDTVTEVSIQEALARLMTDRTSIVIAHRLNTIRQADQIVVIADGRLVGTRSLSDGKVTTMICCKVPSQAPRGRNPLEISLLFHKSLVGRTEMKYH